MTNYDNKRFTEKILATYSETIRHRLPRVKLMLDDGDMITHAISQGVFRIVREYTKSELSFPLDEHMRADGSVDEDVLAEAVANGLSEPLISDAGSELEQEEDDPVKRIGTGQLWIFHRTIPVPFTFGGAQAHFAKNDKTGLFGQAWYDNGALKSMFSAKTEWSMARSGEVKKEPLNIDTLRQGEPPL